VRAASDRILSRMVLAQPPEAFKGAQDISTVLAGSANDAVHDTILNLKLIRELGKDGVKSDEKG
jgi:hypothetical protein